jgi:hypothetical protein
VDAKVAADIEKHGFSIVTVGWSADDRARQPEWADVGSWTYTIGFLETWGHPEVLAFSLSQDVAAAVLWDLAHEIEKGRRFEPGTVYDDALPTFESQVCAFEAVAPEWAPELLGAAVRFYDRPDVPALQYLWPDRDGRFSWDDGFSPELGRAQRDLSAAPTAPAAPPPPR